MPNAFVPNTLERHFPGVVCEDPDVTLEIFTIYPPDEEGRVAQLNERHNGVVDIPAEVRRSGEELWITLFSKEGGPTWEYRFSEFRDALERAAAIVLR